MNSDMRYFIYSKSQLKERDSIENKLGKKFHVGTLITKGQSKQFTQMVKSLDGIRYSDYKIIAYVDINTVKFILPYASF